MANAVRKATRGAVRFKLVQSEQGDEARIAERLAKGELQGAALTAIGLTKLQPALVVQQLPMVFRSYEELDCLRERMNSRFDGLMAEKGYVVLGYGDVGFVHVFTQKPVRTPEDLQDVKMWAWPEDLVGRRVQALTGLTQVPLSPGEVLEALKSGAVNAYYASPYAALAMQWFTKVRYFVDVRMAMAVGAIVVSKASWGTLSEAQQEKVLGTTRRWSKRLAKRIRRDNERALRVLRQQGIERVRLTPGEHSLWLSIAEKVQKHFVGQLYPQDLLDEVKATVRACREAKARK
jgi:TRAP-type C4-dicarboxylate transport system substrate-binding protein